MRKLTLSIPSLIRPVCALTPLSTAGAPGGNEERGGGDTSTVLSTLLMVSTGTPVASASCCELRLCIVSSSSEARAAVGAATLAYTTVASKSCRLRELSALALMLIVARGMLSSAARSAAKESAAKFS